MKSKLEWLLYHHAARRLVEELLIALDRYEASVDHGYTSTGRKHSMTSRVGSRKWLIVQQRAGEIVWWSCKSQGRLDVLGRLLGGPSPVSDYNLRQIAWLSSVDAVPYSCWEIIAISDALRKEPRPAIDLAEMEYCASGGARPDDSIPF